MEGGHYPPAGPRLICGPCTQAQLESPRFRWWAKRMGLTFRLHRKLWEFCFIAQALHERGMLAPGRRGLGFAVGREPLSALFAGFGCEIVATDLHVEKSSTSWTSTEQHAASIEDLQCPLICPPELLRRRVSFRPVDMNNVPEDLTGFDFIWSSCSFEHLGSIGRGRRFLRRMTRCLRPGGVAVHTTELNVRANFRTKFWGETVLYRRRDFRQMVADLEALGHHVEPLDFDTGNGPADQHVDEPPFPQEVHLKLRLGRYVATSFGLIVTAGENVNPAAETEGWSRWLPWRRSA